MWQQILKSPLPCTSDSYRYSDAGILSHAKSSGESNTKQKLNQYSNAMIYKPLHFTTHII